MAVRLPTSWLDSLNGSRVGWKLRFGATLGLAVALSGCGISVPADPGGSLDDAQGSELRVGVAVEPGLSASGTADNPPQGPLPDLALDFAETLEATPTWQIGSEESLVRMLEDDAIDLALGPFTVETPWSDRVSISRPFAVMAGSSQYEFVALLPAGENALLAAFEGFIDEAGIAK